jgi:hypothetical protein
MSRQNAAALTALLVWAEAKRRDLEARGERDPVETRALDAWMLALEAARDTFGDIDLIEAWLWAAELGGMPDELLTEIARLAAGEST